MFSLWFALKPPSMGDGTRLEDEMRAQHVVPNVVTYSTMIKGYANSGDMPKAFALLDLMQVPACVLAFVMECIHPVPCSTW